MVSTNLKGIILGIITLILMLIVIFNLVGVASVDLKASADNVSGSGLPLANLFASNGVLMLVFMSVLFIFTLLAVITGIRIERLK